jgi:hypothetical protein
MINSLTADSLPKIMLANKDYRNLNSFDGPIINIEGITSKYKFI